MLLDHIGEADAARRIESAVGEALADGSLTIGQDGSPVGGTKAATRAIVAAVEGGR
jgi:3-isopropylmalate dehydrogenase